MIYTKICRAIVSKCIEDKLDHRDFIREWVQLFEKTRVVGWKREEFFDDMEAAIIERPEVKEFMRKTTHNTAKKSEEEKKI